MEIGSGSMTDSDGSSTNSSTESLNGLKFGQKIYFENTSATGVGASASATTMGTPPKSGPGSSSSSGSGRKPRGGMVQSAQPPRCQVEGCGVDLSDAKPYYSRHKVCGMHSKASNVIVAGLQQRFCQQCSRFHQLPEFDQGKRSCRRRLAGHNERRRKPPPGSLLASRYSRLSSSMFESSNGGGGFTMDFTAYPRLSRTDVWSTLRSSENVSANQNTATGWSLPHPWQNNLEDTPQNLYLQGTAAPGECLNSNCALSLLSNQPWGSRNQALTLGVNDMMNAEVSSSVSQPAMPHGAVTNPYLLNASCSWGFKANNSGSSSNEIPPHLPINNQFSGGLQLSHQSRRPYMELELSNEEDTTSMQHIHHTL